MLFTTLVQYIVKNNSHNAFSRKREGAIAVFLTGLLGGKMKRR